ncbi:MAG: TonB-dependent receptor [Bacteroidota bacterium]
MNKFTLVILANVLISFMAFSQTQTIRGTVIDKWHGQPLIGATVQLQTTNNAEPLGAVTDENGRYRIEEVPVGRHNLTINYLGYETASVSGLLIEAGKEVIQNISLKETTEALGEVVVTAAAENNVPHPLSNYTLKVEEQFRYATTYYDPVRLAMSLPGVTGTDDQANHITVRGNSPASLQWRLEGVEIVNPNHTANAGTFSDRPTAAGGGVNILSAQLLGTSNFLTGAYPAGYGNALGGIMDMYFRNGNDERHEFTAQAGVIGLEAAAEGPLRGQETGARSGSYLVNYRYSFVGILTAAGADFGGEEITFQDLSFHLNFPVLENAELSFFGMGGLSENIFNSPFAEEEISEEKELFDIDFKSKMGAAGISFKNTFNNKIKLKTTLVYSGLEHERASQRVADVTEPTTWSDDDISENKLAFLAKLFYKKNIRQQWDFGIQINNEQSTFNTFFSDNFGQYTYGGKINGWLFQPFINSYFYLLPKLKLNVGVHGHYFTEAPENIAILPRTALSYHLNKRQQVSLAFGYYAQRHPVQIYSSNLISEESLAPTKSQQITAAFQHKTDKGTLFKTEVYHQYLFDVPVSVVEGSTYSVLNNLENFLPLQDTIAGTGKGRNYGIDFFIEQPILKKSFTRLGASLYRSVYTASDGIERSTRYDGRYLINATGGTEKVKRKNSKTIIRGITSRITFYGGFRQTPILPDASAVAGRTIFNEQEANENKLKDYFRCDMRIYWKWNKPNRSTTLSIDIQNLFGRKNEAFQFYDQVEQQVVTREQLGFIPLLSYRVEF